MNQGVAILKREKSKHRDRIRLLKGHKTDVAIAKVKASREAITDIDAVLGCVKHCNDFVKDWTWK